MPEHETAPQGHEVVVVGASAGGVSALRVLTRSLQPGFPAALLVAQHLGEGSHLVRVLQYESVLPLDWARDGEAIAPGRIYLAPWDVHLLVHDSHLMLRRGPRENLSRPAIDPLFRSAACSLGSRLIGVVLSGLLSDGSAGLRAIKRCGGIAVVQDPRTAQAPDMPRNALKATPVDHCIGIDDMAACLAQLVRTPAGPMPDVPYDIRLEASIAGQELASMEHQNALGQPSTFSCPECGGVLWEMSDPCALRFRCHVGHAYQADALLHADSERADEVLWSLLRQHRERAALTRRMAERETSPPMAARLRSRAVGYEEDAAVIERLLARARDAPTRDEDAGNLDDDRGRGPS
jgi:two-component system chemotaxis response regulator CheB